MELEVIRRTEQKPGCTIGELLINGEHECWTLEDQVREVPGKPVASWKIKGQTAIPCGRYPVELYDSPHFGTTVLRLVGVPGFDSIEVHWGNTAKDTDGCILVGDTLSTNLVLGSRAAFKTLFPKVKAAIDAGEKVFITVR